MKKRKIALKNLAVLALLISSFIACDKDFSDIDSDIINNDNASHFNTNSQDFDVIAYTKVLDPVQTSSLPINMIGVYNDPNYGMTTASVVTQISSPTINPDFGEGVELDSVILTIPYFSTPTEITEEGETLYDLDSVFGSSPIKLSLYESNYFLRDINPNSEDNINEPQLYYSNMSTGLDNISSALLEGVEIPVNNGDIDLDNFVPSDTQIRLTDGDEELTGLLAPSLRLSLGVGYWFSKIIDMQGEPELSNLNNFRDYFRGIYIKAEPINGSGNMMLLNLLNSGANITLYYTKDNDLGEEVRLDGTYTLNFNGNRVNFLSNDFTIQQGNDVEGDESLYLKGGQGSIAEVKLFNGDDIDEDNSTNNIFETFKNEFVETDEEGNFVSSKKLVNEANLVFFVNQDLVNGGEPNRVYIYDIDNQRPLPDYSLDIANTSFPEFSRINHLGRLQREGDEFDGDGIKYKLRITEHINNLLLRDSTNVKLGLAVSGNINLENNSFQYDILNTSDTDETIPVSAIVSPRGTVLFGNNTNTVNDEKKLYLEIFFTEPNNE
ncbi:DUF4270 domain-containing protein [Psychroserpens algicola]|uniref:DUF4270 domain-containing protein n=1 Tax=Psychroserpens algicola TaxID=1719034 RepID=UPI001953C1F3|nr:DUF4270 domain-containing protein [Psychroserpens algicola]